MINLQDTLLNQLRKERVPVTVFLVNGFQIRGTVKGFDSFTVLMDAEGKQELVYKHALSTLIPVKNVQLPSPAALENCAEREEAEAV